MGPALFLFQLKKSPNWYTTSNMNIARLYSDTSVRMLHTGTVLILVLEYVTLAINIVIVHRSDQIYPHLVETVLGECNFTPRVFSDVILILLKKNVERTRMMSTLIFTARYTWHGGAPACFHTRSYVISWGSRWCHTYRYKYAHVKYKNAHCVQTLYKLWKSLIENK